MKKQVYRFAVIFLALFAVVTPVLAESADKSVNLPGWVGGLLAVIALLLPIAFWAWVERSE